jgi:hypothetical protein
MGPTHTTGPFRIRLKEEVRARYRKFGILPNGSGQDSYVQDGYELVIDGGHALKVKRAQRDGTLLTLRDQLRYGFRPRLALISNQPAITSMLPSLIALEDERIGESDVWHLLRYHLEWKVDSAENFYAYFLRGRTFVSEFDVLATIAGEIRDEYLRLLPQVQRTEDALNLATRPIAPLAQDTLNDILIPNVNRRIVHAGVRLHRFYCATPRAPDEELSGNEDRAISSTLTNLRAGLEMAHETNSEDAQRRTAIIGGLHSHLCQPVTPEKGWMAKLLHMGGFDLSVNDLALALNATIQASDARGPITFQASAHTELGTLPPLLVIQKFSGSGRDLLRAANKTTPQQWQARSELRAKALAFFELAQLLTQSPLLSESDGAALNELHFELSAQAQSLRQTANPQRAHIAFAPGSTLYLLALTPQYTPAMKDTEFGEDEQPLRLIHEILPLTPHRHNSVQETVTVLTPAAAARLLGFGGTAADYDLVLQVLEPDAAKTQPMDIMTSMLFWRWKVCAPGETFTINLRPAAQPNHFDVELSDAEFVDARPVRSSQFPPLPTFHRKQEPLELALLIDGYWLANSETNAPRRRTGLALLIDLLEKLDALENATKRGMLIHAAIALDTHISPEFQAVYGSVPSLYTLDESPFESVSQLIAEWLHPWIMRWTTWEIKPYPVDTDIALEAGLRYFRRLRWQWTSHPTQRALLAVGRSRAHDHADYFRQAAVPAPSTEDERARHHEPPYHFEDRFSVTGIDWREELRGLRQTTATVLALCDPGLPNARYRLSTGHPLYCEYQQFWAALDPQTLLDIDDEDGVQCAAQGVGRVLATLESHLFEQRTVPWCDPPVSLPVSLPP